MKKYLMILSSIIGISFGSVTTTLNTQINSSKTNFFVTNQTLKYSNDISNYDVSEGDSQYFQLDNLLLLLKELNQEHKENKVKIEFNNIPRWSLVNDDGKNFAFGWTFLSWFNIESLVNSDFVQFENVLMLIAGDGELLITFLEYTISDIHQIIELFSYQGENIPLKQNNMETIFEVTYQYI